MHREIVNNTVTRRYTELFGTISYYFTFDTVRKKIIKALKKRDLGIQEEVSLANGFISFPLRQQLDNTVELHAESYVHVIVLVGEETGQLYYIAVKSLLKYNE